MNTESGLNGSATYSPEDNKLRMSFATRLPKEVYEQVRAAGFIWAPKQEIFVAPMWTPGREDFAISLCGEIGDEDTSLVERAEARADRFENYSESRAKDADAAHKTVEGICEHIPLDQPILVGHHSERRARKDAERIESGMRKAVKMWEQSKYWTDRAAGALRHAKYLERPDVRARRIKKIEAEKRKQERNRADAEQGLRFWRGEIVLVNRATGEKRKLEISEANREEIHKLLGGGLGSTVGDFNVLPKEPGKVIGFDGWSAWNVLAPDGERYSACPSATVEQCRERAEQCFNSRIKHCGRWIAHFENRLAYERAMLAADGGTATDKTGPEVGGACRCWASHRGGFSYIQKVNRVSVTVLDNWGNEGQMDGKHNFTRTIPFDKCFEVMTRAQVEEARTTGNFVEHPDKTGFRLCGKTEKPKVEDNVCPDGPTCPDPVCQTERAKLGITSESVEAMKETLKSGVQVVSAPQLFPTPPALADRMAETADLFAGERVLEPSAGTGNLLRTIIQHGIFESDCVAVEINQALANRLSDDPKLRWPGYKTGCDFDSYPKATTVCGDFLEQNGNLGKFDKIVMNPPFADGADIKHILHARTFLNSGGKLVAICANGPRQQAALQPLASSWEPLPAGTFKESGTNVNTVLLTIEG
jgi:protein-L-isoaspartate O-methyltransferase